MLTLSPKYLPVIFQNSITWGGYDGQINITWEISWGALEHIFLTGRDPANTFSPDPYDFCVAMLFYVIFTNTLSPFTKLDLLLKAGSRDGEKRFKSYFAINANKRLGFGFY